MQKATIFSAILFGALALAAGMLDGSIPEPVRTPLHRRAAEALAVSGGSPAVVARHWLEGGEEGKAVPHLLEAVERAERASRHEEALAFAEQAAAIRERRGNRAGAPETL